jgi:Raf kinase inhibitor-like YbhB/YbcL family protein
MGTFTHWIIYNVPATATGLSENINKTQMLPDGSRQGKNGFGNIGYNGPAPPPGKVHHYYLRLYALDMTLSLDAGASRDEVVKAMNGHVLAEGELMGTDQSR